MGQAKAIKQFVKYILAALKIDATPNMRYDRLTLQIMKKHLSATSNCIDVGAHTGAMLKQMLLLSPRGMHYAFEPIPALYNGLIAEFTGRAIIKPFAVSSHRGTAQFYWVKNADAYSGLKRRKYEVVPEIEMLKVQTETLDDVVDAARPVAFIKIDVEGGELDVLKGGVHLIRKHKPLIVFEFGIGASDYYNVTPAMMFDLINDTLSLKVNTLEGFLKSTPALNRLQLQELYINNREYYFIAYP